jgi:predicted anti-sigma-YlaC factor YlaD
MKCHEVLAALSEYVDGELDPSLVAFFEEHVKGCSPCEVVIDNVRQTVTLYKCGQSVEVPPAFHQRLRDLLRAQWKAKFPSAEV